MGKTRKYEDCKIIVRLECYNVIIKKQEVLQYEKKIICFSSKRMFGIRSMCIDTGFSRG